MGDSTRVGRMVTTDESGRYAFTELPAGRYMLRVSKAGYVDVWYGQTRAFESGRPLELGDGQSLGIDIALPPGAVITGRAVDEFGEPAEEARVTVLRAETTAEGPRFASGGPTTVTDDLGEFRLFGLAPGQYYLSAAASTRVVGPPVDTGAPVEYATTFFPSTANPAEAQPLTIGVGQTISDVLIALVPGRKARITGTAVDSRGRPMAGQVMASPRGRDFLGAAGLGRGPIRPDGSFTIERVPPGSYLLQAVNGSGDERASGEVVVSEGDLDGIRLVGVRPVTASGRLVADAAAPLFTLRPGAIRVIAAPVDDSGGIPFSMFAEPPPVHDDFTFVTQAWPGRMRLMVNMPPGWTVRSVRHRGADVTDSGIDFTPDEEIAGIEIELTNRVAEVSGGVTDGRGLLVKEYSVLVFPQDRERRTAGSRYIRSARPDQNGRFIIDGLPAGDYWAIALDRLDDIESRNPDFLDRMSTAATSFTLVEGDIKAFDLRLNAGP